MSRPDLLTRLRPWRVLSQSLDLLRQEVAILRNDMAILRQDLANLESILRQDLVNQEAALRKEARTVMLHSRLASFRASWSAMMPASFVPAPPIIPEPFETYLEKFRALHPHLYLAWASINFGSNVDEFRERPGGSCSVGDHPGALLFAGFVAPYLHGRVLDLGCGPYPLPVYLQGYLLNLISGIDPLPPFEPHPFEFVQGFAEFLPWPQASFDVVLAATSLDHVMSLDLTLAEIRRVLKPGGFFLVWEGFLKGSKRYDPYDQNLEPADQFHFFHFDEGWFEEVIASHFSVQEKLDCDGLSLFYALQLRAATAAPVGPIVHK